MGDPDPFEIDRQRQDKYIQGTRALFIHQFHVTMPVLGTLLREKYITLQGSAKKRLEARLFFNTKMRYTNGDEVACDANGPFLHSFEITIKRLENGDCMMKTAWELLMLQSKMEINAVFSIWGYKQKNWKTAFIFRLDGYADENNPMPPLPMFPQRRLRVAPQLDIPPAIPEEDETDGGNGDNDENNDDEDVADRVEWKGLCGNCAVI